MSLFGALSSGVAGLTAQSSAMGAISDNITNVSTVGYKSTQVNFASLVTKQTSGTFYSAGGVQSKPRQDRLEVERRLRSAEEKDPTTTVVKWAVGGVGGLSAVSI